MDQAEPKTVELAIRDALPGDEETEYRVALLRIHHAAERAQLELATLGRTLGDHVRDPEPLYTGRLLYGAAEDTATKLVSLAAELRKSSRRLIDLAAQRWREKRQAGA